MPKIGHKENVKRHLKRFAARLCRPSSGEVDHEEEGEEGVRERETKKKKPTPENSAASNGRGCPSQ